MKIELLHTIDAELVRTVCRRHDDEDWQDDEEVEGYESLEELCDFAQFGPHSDDERTKFMGRRSTTVSAGRNDDSSRITTVHGATVTWKK